MPVLDDLDQFIKEADETLVKSKWLQDKKMRVYVRKGRHIIDGKMTLCLDIANVLVYEQGKGTFTHFIGEAHRMNPWQATFVECVQEPRLASFLLRNGWSPINDGESFFLKKRRTVYEEQRS